MNLVELIDGLSENSVQESLALRQYRDFISDLIGVEATDVELIIAFNSLAWANKGASLAVQSGVRSKFLDKAASLNLPVNEGEFFSDFMNEEDFASFFKSCKIAIIYEWNPKWNGWISRITTEVVFVLLGKFEGFCPSSSHVVLGVGVDWFVFKLCNAESDAKISVDGVYNIVDSNNSLVSWSGVSPKFRFHIKGRNNYVYIGRGVSLSHGRIRIKGDNCRVVILDKSNIMGSLDVISGNRSFIEIGRGVHFTNANTRIVAQESGVGVSIGNNSLVGEVTMRTSDGHSLMDCSSGERINPASSIFIGARVWIAQGVRILKGVVLAHDSIVAAGSVVTRSNMEKNTVIGGNPARIIRRGVYWLGKRV